MKHDTDSVITDYGCDQVLRGHDNYGMSTNTDGNAQPNLPGWVFDRVFSMVEITAVFIQSIHPILLSSFPSVLSESLLDPSLWITPEKRIAFGNLENYKIFCSPYLKSTFSHTEHQKVQLRSLT